MTFHHFDDSDDYCYLCDIVLLPIYALL